MPLAQTSVAALESNATNTLEASPPPPTHATLDECHESLKQETSEYPEPVGLPQWPLDREVSMTSQQEEDIDPDSLPLSQQNSPEKGKKSSSKTPKPADSGKDKSSKPSKHSSKNEGQHTDRRYLCYLCTKLFTRRRSVRDHIAKIHNVKSWEPVRSLEVIVDPVSGEPIEPLEDIVARGPPPPPARHPKAHKDKTGKPEEEDTTAEAETVEGADQEDDLAISKDDLHSLRFSEVKSPRQAAEMEIKHEDEQSRYGKAPSPERVSTAVNAPAPSKKRPASELTKPLPASITKKGVVRPKPTHTPNKKIKLSESESISEKSTPLHSPSATPAASSRAPASKLKKQVTMARNSPTPVSSRMTSMEPASPATSAADTPGSSNDDGEIFCICRKGDNHSWMIACDGGCDDWFHGNCVHIRERDGDLIDKYICPNCTRAGLHTTWKRMCRRKHCRKPAQVFQEPPSKYCSRECGRMFFIELIRRGDPYIDTVHDQYVVDSGRPKKMRKVVSSSEKSKKTKVPKAIPMVNGIVGELVNSDSRLATPALSDAEKSEYETDSSADEDELPNRGGALRAGELKAIMNKCTTIEQWRELGRKPDTPPREPDGMEVKLEFDEFEMKELDKLAEEKAVLEKRNVVLEAREKTLELMKARSAGITEEIKKAGPKDKKGNSKLDPCGFDPRLAWTEDSFLDWYDRRDGKTSLESGRVGPPDDLDDDKKMTNGVTEAEDSDDESEEKEMPKKGGVCVRNRCPRHRNWAKGSLAEIRFEQDIARRGLRKCEDSDKEIRERAMVRAWERLTIV